MVWLVLSGFYYARYSQHGDGLQRRIVELLRPLQSGHRIYVRRGLIHFFHYGGDVLLRSAVRPDFVQCTIRNFEVTIRVIAVAAGTGGKCIGSRLARAQ